MNTKTLENFALISIIAGMVIAYFFIFDYEPVDAFFDLTDNNAYLNANVLSVKYIESSEYYQYKVRACRDFFVYSKDDYLLNNLSQENRTFYGSVSENSFFTK